MGRDSSPRVSRSDHVTLSRCLFPLDERNGIRPKEIWVGSKMTVISKCQWKCYMRSSSKGSRYM